MGLAVGQIQLLSLTRRKADCEYNISVNAMRKMQLTKEMTQLTQEYNSRLSRKNVVFYDNGKYNKVTYGYLMGYGSLYTSTFNGSRPLKDNPSMVLTDNKGQVVLSDSYANAIIAIMGNDIINTSGQGSTFPEDKIPEILEKLCPGMKAEDFKDGIQDHSWTATTVNTLTGDVTGSTIVNTSVSYQDKIDSILKYYYPILQAAANNGWTTEYNHQIAENENYVSDAISSGVFCLAGVDDYGHYEEGTSLTYYATSGDIDLRSDSETREQITLWYDAEKERIGEKENWIDLEQQDLSTELEAIKTEIDSIKQFINDAVETVFNWGG